MNTPEQNPPPLTEEELHEIQEAYRTLEDFQSSSEHQQAKTALKKRLSHEQEETPDEP